jgi:hypothetical protein
MSEAGILTWSSLWSAGTLHEAEAMIMLLTVMSVM